MNTKTSFLILFLCIVVSTSFAQQGRFLRNAIEYKLDKDAASNTGPVALTVGTR